jgi:hypothetical protein
MMSDLVEIPRDSNSMRAGISAEEPEERYTRSTNNGMARSCSSFFTAAGAIGLYLIVPRPI